MPLHAETEAVEALHAADAAREEVIQVDAFETLATIADFVPESVRERAKSLIEVAHPDFRDSLRESG